MKLPTEYFELRKVLLKRLHRETGIGPENFSRHLTAEALIPREKFFYDEDDFHRLASPEKLEALWDRGFGAVQKAIRYFDFIQAADHYEHAVTHGTATDMLNAAFRAGEIRGLIAERDGALRLLNGGLVTGRANHERTAAEFLAVAARTREKMALRNRGRGLSRKELYHETVANFGAKPPISLKTFYRRLPKILTSEA